MISGTKVQLYMYDLSGGMAAQMSLQLTGKANLTLHSQDGAENVKFITHTM